MTPLGGVNLAKAHWSRTVARPSLVSIHESKDMKTGCGCLLVLPEPVDSRLQCPWSVATGIRAACGRLTLNAVGEGGECCE